MAETHELRLKIDATAAKRGSRDFTAAIEAVKRAVRELERDSSGAFTQLKKNMADLSKNGSMKVGVDRQSIRNLNDYAKAHSQLTKSASTSQKGLSSLIRDVRGLSDSYKFASGTAKQFAADILKTNSALMRQIQLASQARSAVRQVRTAPGSSAPISAATAPTIMGPAASQSASAVVASQDQIQRSIAQTRSQVESLTTALMKVGGFGAMAQLHRDFAQFESEASRAGATTRQLATAKNVMATATANARTSLTTLNAVVREESRAAKEASDAKKAQARASADAAAEAKREQTARDSLIRSQNTSINLSIRSAEAMRRAEQEAALLTTRLRAMGDSSGITAINQALIRLKANLSGGVSSATQLRTAMNEFANTTSQSRIAITNHNAAMAAANSAARDHARAESQAASEARRTEREMRSLAGATNATSQAFNRATGSMRGLENAFSGTFQVGSAFRTMIGSITLGTFISSVYSAGDALSQFRVAMEVATGSQAGAMAEMDYITGMASRLGVGLDSARANYSKFAIAADLAGVSADSTRNIFESVSTALAVLGKGTEDQNLAFMALEQMMSKGTVSSEELRRQLGERLPGAVQMMADALGVSMEGLQDLLKAGAISSSDALPKFAREVMETYGPALAAATQRAGFNLGTLRNEVTLLQETVANSGFMQVLSNQFRDLTNALRSDAGADMAERLGEGLAMMAEVGGDALQFIITHLDELGVVIKAIAGGVVVRQVALMGAAFATGAQHLSGWMASLGRGQGVLAPLTAMQNAYRTAMAASTAEIIKETAAQTANTAATAKGTAADAAAMRAVFARTTATQRLTAGLVGLRAGAAAAASGLGAVATAFTVMAPVIGIAVTALSILPLLFSDASAEAARMADEIDAAVRRSGASFDKFSSSIADSRSTVEISKILRDLDTLERTRTVNLEANFGQIAGDLQFLMRGLDGGLKTALIGSSNDEIRMDDLGLSEEFFDGLSSGARTAAKDMVQLTARAQAGEVSFLELRSAIANALFTQPNASPILNVLQSQTEKMQEAELASVELQSKLNMILGNEDQRTVQNFANLAQAFVATGGGLDAMDAMIKDIREKSPDLADDLKEIMSRAREFRNERGDPFLFMQDFHERSGTIAKSLTDLRSEAESASKAAATSAATITKNLMGALNGAIADGLDPAAFSQMKDAIDSYLNFDNAAVTVDTLRSVLSTVEFPTAKAQEFSNEVMRQYQMLPQTAQTYDSLRQIMANVADTTEYASVASSGFVQTLADVVRQSGVAGQTAEDLEAAIYTVLETFGITGDEAIRYADEIINAADRNTDLAREAASADLAVSSSVSSMLAAGNAAASASPQVQALANAFNALKAARSAASEATSESLGDLRARAAIANIEDRGEQKVQQFLRLGEGAKELAKIDEALSSAQQAVLDGRRAGLGGDAMNDLMKEVNGFKAEREAYVNEATKLILAEEANRDRVSQLRRDAAKADRKGSGSSRKAKLSDEEKALKRVMDKRDDMISGLMKEQAVRTMLNDGLFETADAAQLAADMMEQGVNIFDDGTLAILRQIDAAEQLNDALTEAARDPLKEWQDSVPSYQKIGNDIEAALIGSVQQGMEDLMTGDFSWEDFGNRILSDIAGIVAPKATEELFKLTGLDKMIGGAGDWISGLGGDDPLAGDTTGMASGGQQAAQTISQAMLQAGQQISQQIAQAMGTGGQQAANTQQVAMQQAGQQAANAQRTAGMQTSNQLRSATIQSGTQHAQTVKQAIVSGGQQHANSVAMANAAGGGTGGNIVSTALSFMGMGSWGDAISTALPMVLGAFSEGGLSTSPVGTASMPAAAFHNAPHYAQGTANTSGIPAVLHPNEAVIPLSKGRKVPVEMGDSAGGVTQNVINQNITINTPDADSFRKSKKQLAADMAASGQRALKSNS
ncbi:tape measure protein [Ruegeria phage RpAliso]|nr:tape measure protein [Ruegeria phage RpAliso]